MNQLRTLHTKKNSLVSKDSLSISKRSLKPRRLKSKTRNISIKNDSVRILKSREGSTTKLRPYDSNNQVNYSKAFHRRSGTSFVSNFKVSESLSSLPKTKKTFKKDLQNLKISKDIMRRLKRRSIHSQSDQVFGMSFGKSKERMGDTQALLESNASNYFSSKHKKVKKSKDFPLPTSSTGKKLKKVISNYNR